MEVRRLREALKEAREQLQEIKIRLAKELGTSIRLSSTRIC
jgi:hypothetical protein